MVLKCVVKNDHHTSALPIHIKVTHRVCILAVSIGDILYHESCDVCCLLSTCLNLMICSSGAFYP